MSLWAYEPMSLWAYEQNLMKNDYTILEEEPEGRVGVDDKSEK